MASVASAPSAYSWFVNPDLVRGAAVDSVRRLTPRYQWRNPVMFVVYVGSIVTTVLWLQALLGTGEAPAGFILAITLWLWSTLLFARYWLAIPVLALAGAFAAAKSVSPSAGTLRTSTPLFVVVLIGTVITVGALTFVPALALGPVVEHLQLHAAR